MLRPLPGPVWHGALSFHVGPCVCWGGGRARGRKQKDYLGFIRGWGVGGGDLWGPWITGISWLPSWSVDEGNLRDLGLEDVDFADPGGSSNRQQTGVEKGGRGGGRKGRNR